MSAWQIPLSVVQPKLNSPLDTATKATNLRGLALGNTQAQQVIDENALKLQSMKEDEEDQKSIQEAMGKHYDPDTHMVDFDKVKEEIRPKVRLRNMQGLENLHATALKNTLQMDADKRAKLLAHNQTIGNEILGILQTPADQRQAAYSGARQRLIDLGDIKADDPDYPEQVPDEGSLKGHLAHVGYAAQVQKLATDAAAEEQKKAAAEKARADAAKAQAAADAKELQQKIEDAARDYLKVDDQASHDEWLSNLDKDVAKRMPKKFDKEKTHDLIENMALSSLQRDQKADRRLKATTDKTVTPIEVALEYARAKLGPNAPKDKVYDLALTRMSETTKEGKFEPTAPQHKESISGYDKASKEESDLYPQLQRLNDAIATGAMYLDDKGKAVSMVDYVKDAKGDAAKEAEMKAAAIESMKQNADSIREKAKAAIRRKYSFAERLGSQGEVSLDQALQAIDAGKYGGAKAATPPPQEQAAPPAAAVQPGQAAAPARPPSIPATAQAQYSPGKTWQVLPSGQ
jgi:hypothetical protein